MVREFVFKLSGKVQNQYVVKIPTAGQLIDIELEKVRLSGGLYGGLVRVGTVGSANALNSVDAMAYINILVPELIGDLKVASLSELDAFDFNILLKDFRKQMEPWVDEYLKVLDIPEMAQAKEQEKEEDPDKVEETED